MAAPFKDGMSMLICRNVYCRRDIIWLQINRYKSSRSKKHGLDRTGAASTTYDGILRSHQEVADRSILVAYGGKIGDPYQTCTRHGAVQAVYPFTSGPKNYALFQMTNRSSVDSILSNSRQFDNHDKIPIKSRFLYHPGRQENERLSPSCPHGLLRNTKIDDDDKALNNVLLRSKSSDDQIRSICKFMSMSDFALRVRFFLCSALAETLHGTLPGCSISPFGSTVNGFGRNSGDLDMLLETDKYEEPQQYLPKDGFRFLSKKKQENSRFQVQMTLETVGGIISHFIPQFGFVRRILKARVPIVRFSSSSTGIECDLSINNRSALYMSELLHLYSQLDHRVRPLVFTIRHWAKVNDVTQSKPGLYISNFMLTWMVIFFLQTTVKPVVPSISQLESYAGPEDQKSLNGDDITFVRDWMKVPPSTNTQHLGELLLDFFRFYSSFDFEHDAISLHRGVFTKPSGDLEGGVLYIENPIETQLNAGKIVSETELKKFQEACNTAMRKLDNSLKMKPGRTPWGIMSLFIDNGSTDKRLNLAISEIFSQAESSSDKNKETLGENDVSSPISGSFSDTFNDQTVPKPEISESQDDFSELKSDVGNGVKSST